MKDQQIFYKYEQYFNANLDHLVSQFNAFLGDDFNYILSNETSHRDLLVLIDKKHRNDFYKIATITDEARVKGLSLYG